MSGRGVGAAMAGAARRGLGAALAEVARRFGDRAWFRAFDERLDLHSLADRLQYEAAAHARWLDGRPESRLKISLVIPCHGVPRRYVEELLGSVEAQRHRAWEVCACDDGDPNRDVAALLAERARRAPERYRLIAHDRNRGIAAATRSAIGLARGEVIAFVDADDLLHEDALRAVAARFDDSADMDFVYTDNDWLTDWGWRTRRVVKPAWSPELLAGVNYINHLTAARRDCLSKVMGEVFVDEYSGSQDWALCLAMARVARRVGHVPLSLYHWRARPGSVAHAPGAKPWAFEAGMRLCREHAAALDPRIEMRVDPPYIASLRVREGAALPALWRINVGQGGGRDGQDPGSCNHHIDIIDVMGNPILDRSRATNGAEGIDAIARALDEAIARAATREDDLLLFATEGGAPITGEIDRMVAFAIQRGVGCVMPFGEGGALRRAYTVAGAGRLMALAAPRSEFSQLTGNVLAGPLHGMMLRCSIWRRVGGLTGAVASVGPGGGVEALGAAVGVAALGAGFRNVAVRGVVCDSAPPPVTLSRAPAIDPYL